MMRYPTRLKLMSILSAGIFVIIPHLSAKGQVSATTVQSLSFGTFCFFDKGGTIEISSTGTRKVTGEMISINQNTTPFMQAIIEVVAPIGSRLSILNLNTQLHGNKGGTMTLKITGSDPVTPLTTTTTKTNFGIGGIITVGNTQTNPAGKYSGTFYITFILE